MRANRIITLILSILAILQLMNAQNNIQLLDLQLANYNYGYPSKTLMIESQNQKLEMSYMYVKPDVFNGKTIMLLHGKNFRPQ